MSSEIDCEIDRAKKRARARARIAAINHTAERVGDLPAPSARPLALVAGPLMRKNEKMA